MVMDYSWRWSDENLGNPIRDPDFRHADGNTMTGVSLESRPFTTPARSGARIETSKHRHKPDSGFMPFVRRHGNGILPTINTNGPHRIVSLPGMMTAISSPARFPPRRTLYQIAIMIATAHRVPGDVRSLYFGYRTLKTSAASDSGRGLTPDEAGQGAALRRVYSVQRPGRSAWQNHCNQTKRGRVCNPINRYTAKVDLLGAQGLRGRCRRMLSHALRSKRAALPSGCSADGEPAKPRTPSTW
jgi:hypothetical protein